MTARFNVKVSFTGLFLMVPDAEIPAKVALVCPRCDADAEQISDADRRPVDVTRFGFFRRHRLFVTYDLSNTLPPATVPGSNKGVWYLSSSDTASRSALTFDVTSSQTGLAFGPKVASRVPSLSSILGDLAKIDTNIVDHQPPVSVGGQIIIDRGTLRTPNQATETNIELTKWSVPSTSFKTSQGGGQGCDCQPTVRTQTLTHYLILEMNGVESFSLVRRRFSDNSTERLALAAPENKTVELAISHLCDINPLLWRRDDYRRVKDEDFKWYYFLLDSAEQSNITLRLNDLEAPIPYPAGASGGQGGNCLIARSSPINF